MSGSSQVAAGPVTVGIDIGTGSVKALAADEDGNVVERARVAHPIHIPSPTRMEHDANQAWRRGPRKAFKAINRPDAAGVSVTAMVPSLTAVDRRGVPISPGLLYGDERGRTDGPDMPAGSGEAVQFLKWTSAEYPDARGFWAAQATANFALSGRAAMSSSAAFSSTPLYTGTEWNPEVLEECGLKQDNLPEVEFDGHPVGTVENTNAVLDAGSIDAMCEQLVAGADNDGDVLVICGTTLITWCVAPEWREVDHIWTIPHTAPGKMLMGGPSNAGGLFLNWATKLAGRPQSTPQPRRVPVWSPYVRGERTPIHDPDRRAQLVDLDLTHDGAALRRAAYEAAGFVARHHIELSGVDAKRIVATGGGIRVPEWIQSLADCTGLPVDVVAVAEGGALGAAFLGRVAAGLETAMTDASRWARTSHTVDPDPAWVEACDERYATFRELARS